MEATERVNRDEAIKALASVVLDKYGNGSPASLKAMAAEIIGFVETDTARQNIAPLLLNDASPVVGDVKLAKEPTHTSYWIDEDGGIVASKDKKNLVTPSSYVQVVMPTVNILDLRRGHVIALQSQVDKATDDLTGKLNKKVSDLFVAAADATMTFTVATTMTASEMDDALSAVEDKGLVPLYWVGRASRFSDVKADTTLATSVKAELQLKGVQAITYGGANFMYVPDMLASKVLLVCKQKAGWHIPEFALEQKEIEDAHSLQIGVKMWRSLRLAITNPLRFALINIT